MGGIGTGAVATQDNAVWHCLGACRALRQPGTGVPCRVRQGDAHHTEKDECIYGGS